MIEVGVLVQVEINGVLVLPEPAPVRAVHVLGDETWVLVEGSNTGVRLDDIVLMAA